MAGKEEKTNNVDTGASIRKTISPYDITSSDNPGSLITQVQLKGENYDEWARSLRTALRARKKFGFIDGTLKRPEEGSADLEDWWTNNSLLVSWIMNTIEPFLRSTISHMEVAQDLWEDIKERFSIMNGPRIQQLKAELVECKQRGLTIVTYYGKLKKLWEELGNFEQIPSCKCGLCTCNLSFALEKKREEEKVHQFLMGLDETVYGTVRSNLLAQDPLPNLNKVYSVLLQEERVRTVTRGKDEKEEVMAFVVQSGSHYKDKYERKDKRGSCSHCNRSGHDSENCFQIVGYPEWWGERPRSSGKGGGRSKPGQGNVTGGKGRGGNVKAHVAQVAMSDTRTDGEGSDTIHTAVNGLTGEQWQTLVSLLNTAKLGATEKLNGKCSISSWIIDTGASHHMTGHLECLTDVYDVVDCPVGLPNGDQIIATKKGTVLLSNTLKLTNVLYVPNLNCSLVSVSKLIEQTNCVVKFTDKSCIIQDHISRMMIGAGEQREGLYYLEGKVTVAALKTKNKMTLDLWHKRLGHASFGVIKMIPNVESNRNNDLCNQTCEICLKAKQIRESFCLSRNKSDGVFQLIHCDLWGPYRTPSFCGARYFLTIVDDFSRAVWIYLLSDKKEAPKYLCQFLAMVERQFNKQVKIIRSDNGTEFTCLGNYFRDRGIMHETSCIGTPQQNGKVERKHRHILSVARALRFQANFPIEFWGECVMAACHLINRTPARILQGKTPYEILYGKPPSLTHLRVVGCLCYVHNQHHMGDKFAARSRRCVFVGYPYGKKGWRMYDLELGSFFVSRDAVFCENQFPYAMNSSHDQAYASSHGQVVNSPVVPINFCDNDDHTSRGLGQISRGRDITQPDIEQISLGRDINSPDNEHINQELDQTSQERDVPLHDTEQISRGPDIDRSSLNRGSEIVQSSVSSDSDTVETLGRGHRIKMPSARLRDYVTNTVFQKSSSPCSTAPTCSSGTPYPLAHYVSSTKFSLPYRQFLAAVTAGIEPHTFSEAVKNPQWRCAMQQEIQALENNGTWSVQSLPPGKKAIGCKWVYRIKYNSDGSVERFKARLVILGNNQIEGLDYRETFAPVAKMVTVRTFLAVAAAKRWELHQMDVHNAFLHGDLDEEVYMKMPPGFQSQQSNQVCRLHKSLYGLKQAPRCWFAKLAGALKQYGFTQSYSDYSLFTLCRENIKLHVLVYVDDLVIASNSSEAIRSFKTYLSTCFHMKDLGALKYFLGIEVARSSAGIFLCQRKYALDIITETGLLGAKPVSFPLDQNHQLALATGAPLSNPEQYRRLVGRLIYLTVTRPELSYCVHILAQFMQKPLQDHWEAALRIVRYLKSNPGQGILLRADCDLQLYAWCDSDWAGCPLTRRSLSGWLVFLGNSPISWKTKKQCTVSRSSAEAEYRSMAITTCELKWLKALLRSLGVIHTQPMQLHCDSQSALHIAANPIFHERTKHIEVDCHFLRDEILSGNLVAQHVSTRAQLADIFTKALGKQQFDSFLGKLGIQNLHAPT